MFQNAEAKKLQAASSCSVSSLSALAPRFGPLSRFDFDQANGFGFRHAVDRRDFARHPVECGLIELAFGIGLLRLVLGAIEIAHDFRDRNQVAGVDLGVIFLRASRPHGALDARATLHDLQRALDIVRLGQLAHADRGGLRHRNLQGELALLEIDDEQFQLVARDFLLVDRDDLADAMRRIDDVLAGLETVPAAADFFCWVIVAITPLTPFCCRGARLNRKRSAQAAAR